MSSLLKEINVFLDWKKILKIIFKNLKKKVENNNDTVTKAGPSFVTANEMQMQANTSFYY